MDNEEKVKVNIQIALSFEVSHEGLYDASLATTFLINYFAKELSPTAQMSGGITINVPESLATPEEVNYIMQRISEGGSDNESLPQ